MQHDKPDDPWIRDTLKRLWPLMEAEASLRDYEFTAGAFLDGRAIYVSALGPQPLEKALSNDWTAVYYYIHAYTDDEWQIGRLVDRINTLGTLRLASTMEIRNLSEAGVLVDELSTMIDTASDMLQQAISESRSGVKGGAPSPDSTALANRPSNAIAQIDAIMLSIQEKVNDIDAKVSGNISARLERSSNYLAQFRTEAKALRERRIEGYQKYQEFVARRLSGVFGYLELLRRRLTEINSARASLVRQYSSLKITTVTSEIGKIQDIGDVALIGILIPYYVGMMINHVFDLEHDPHRPLWTLAIMTIFALVLVYRRRKKDVYQKPWKARGRSVSAAFIAYVVIMWLTYLLEPYAGEAWASVSTGIERTFARPVSALRP